MNLFLEKDSYAFLFELHLVYSMDKLSEKRYN